MFTSGTCAVCDKKVEEEHSLFRCTGCNDHIVMSHRANLRRVICSYDTSQVPTVKDQIGLRARNLVKTLQFQKVRQLSHDDKGKHEDRLELVT